MSVVFYHVTKWFIYPKTEFYDGLTFLLSFGEDGGKLGVMFFFILSGFLITYLMFVEQSKNGSIDIPFFYFRRVVRIWPLYYVTLLVGFLIYPLFLRFMGRTHIESADAFLYSVFVANFDHIYNHNPNSGILGVQWSVAIEEQFYLLWPLVFYFLSKKRIFPWVLLLIILLSEIFFIKAGNWSMGYYHLVSNFRFLAFGGLLAFFCYSKRILISPLLNKISPKANFTMYLLCISMLLFHNKLASNFPYLNYLYHFLPLLFFGYVIVEQNFSTTSWIKIGSFKILNWLGKISYGLYLTHMIAIYIVLGIFKSADTSYVIWEIILSVLITIAISHLSYKYMESYFLSLKDKFHYFKGVFR